MIDADGSLPAANAPAYVDDDVLAVAEPVGIPIGRSTAKRALVGPSAATAAPTGAADRYLAGDHQAQAVPPSSPARLVGHSAQ